MIKIAGIDFPPEAQAILSLWCKRSDCIQTMTVPPMPNTCQNCNGGEFVYLRLLVGSFSTPPVTKEAITWLDGYWRIIKEQVSYVCPMCAGKGATRSVRTSTPEEAQDMVDNLPGVGELVEDWTDH
jgi:hypothetical protein